MLTPSPATAPHALSPHYALQLVGHDPREAEVTAAAARWKAGLSPEERALVEEEGAVVPPLSRRRRVPSVRGRVADAAAAAATAALFCGFSVAAPPPAAAVPRVCRAVVELAARAGVDTGDAAALRAFASRVAIMPNDELDALRAAAGSGGEAA
jgi:hypothetical protein